MIHEDLLAVQRLWANIHAAEQLQAERTALLEAVAEAERSLGAANTEIEAAQQERQAAVSAERQVLRKLETYQKKVEDTRKLIDEGRAPDFLAAQRQLDGCLRMVDDLETATLEAMEARDAANQRVARAEKGLEEVTARRAQLEHATGVGLPRIERELETLEQERPGLEAQVSMEHIGPFRQLRRQRRSVVALMKNGVCSACNYSVAPQVVLEVERGTRVHTCRTCGRFLMPEE